MSFVLKDLFWRIVVEDDGFTFRNVWGKVQTYSFGDIISISVKPKYYIIIFADTSITVNRRTVRDCMRFFDEAASHGVEIVE